MEGIKKALGGERRGWLTTTTIEGAGMRTPQMLRFDRHQHHVCRGWKQRKQLRRGDSRWKKRQSPLNGET
jgi:hypothetical protein